MTIQQLFENYEKSLDERIEEANKFGEELKISEKFLKTKGVLPFYKKYDEYLLEWKEGRIRYSDNINKNKPLIEAKLEVRLFLKTYILNFLDSCLNNTVSKPVFLQVNNDTN